MKCTFYEYIKNDKTELTLKFNKYFIQSLNNLDNKLYSSKQLYTLLQITTSYEKSLFNTIYLKYFKQYSLGNDVVELELDR